ncbi:RNA degradosome polyphosphate kinase [Furfurilactobacillus sp. WILCCON 0119]
MDYTTPELYVNRELSWVDFDDRVLEEARDKTNPLLERARFLGITQSNLDEFFMVRVASLRKMEDVNYVKPDASGMTASDQLTAISVKVHQLVEKQYSTLNRSLLPQLEAIGVHVRLFDELTPTQVSYLTQYFREVLYPVLTPMAVDISRPFPFISNNTLNIAFRLVKNTKDEASGKKEHRFATMQVPGTFNRVVAVPGTNEFVLLEEILKHFAGELFTGFKVKEAHTYRVIRDMDLDVTEEDASDLLKEVEHELALRDHTQVMRLEIDASMSKQLRKQLIKDLEAREADVYDIKGPIDLRFLSKLVKQVKGHTDLLYPAFKGAIQPALRQKDMFAAIKKQDLFVHHPYDSFEPVVRFVRQAASDPDTLAIKMTLYRVSSQSPIIKYLAQAARNGKQVTVLVELKARFDEENNVKWAQQLEHEGCHVIYGLVGLKTHCKLLLVVRQEADGIKRYMHMATGNYNDVTAKLYTDMGIFTADPLMGVDASNVFNMLSGFSEPDHFERVAIAPTTLRDFLYDRINDEIDNAKAGRPAHIRMKMNSLSDRGMIQKLYAASAAGVKIDLIVRGIVCLKVGIPGVSDNITVHSLVGRLLEHSRIYDFYANGEHRIYLSSADLMTRNISRRVELLFPVLQDDIKAKVSGIYNQMWHDTVKTRVLHEDGTWTKVDRRGLALLDVQEHLIEAAKEQVQQDADRETAKPQTPFTPLMRPTDDTLTGDHHNNEE